MRYHLTKSLAVILILIAAALFFSSCANSKKVHSSLRQTQGTASVPVERVYFPTNGASVIKKDVPNLEKNAEWLKNNGDAVVILEGHCDERGDDEYNLELGDRRARSVKAELIRLGVNEEKLSTIISFGERKPLDTHHNPTAWQKNRRVEFVLR